MEEDGLQFNDHKEPQNSGTRVSCSIIFWEANLGNDATRLEKQAIAEQMWVESKNDRVMGVMPLAGGHLWRADQETQGLPSIEEEFSRSE